MVLACYNEEETLESSFARDLEVARGAARDQRDHLRRRREPRPHAEIIRRLVAEHPGRVRAIFHETNRGRGATVNDGFRASRAEIVGFLDVDLEVHARYIPSLVRAIEEGADVATVRRIYAFQARSLDRYFMSRGYSLLVRRLLGVPLQRHRDRIQVLPAREAPARAGRDPRPGLVLGHGVHGARAPAADCASPRSPERTCAADDKTSTVRGLRDSWTYFGKLLAFRKELRAAP